MITAFGHDELKVCIFDEHFFNISFQNIIKGLEILNIRRKSYTQLSNAAAFWLHTAVMNFDVFAYIISK